jgi:selenocysteine-specific elongation factor
LSSLVIGTAGHIDHGKSALVKALTGTDPDRLKEEQERGITIDLGFAHATIGAVDVGFIDVPGHERFVRNMLAGAGGIDAVLLIVAADESVKPQTREHFEICRLLGIERGLIALTKSDLADQDMLDLAALEVRELVTGSFLESASIVPVSARTGAGLDALRTAIASIARASTRPGRRDIVRLPIDRVFTVRGFGTVVTGTLVAGRVSEGDELIALPDDRRVRIRGLQVHGQPVRAVEAPHRVAVNLGAVDVHALARGVTLATPGALPVTRRVDVRLELLAGAPPVRHGARVRVHHATADLEARVTVCAVRTEGSTWRQAQVGDRAVTVAPGAEAFVRLRLAAPMTLARYDRLVLRALSPPETIGGAVVLDPITTASGLRRPAALARFEALDLTRATSAHDTTRRAAVTWLSEAAEHGLDAAGLAARGGVDLDLAARCLVQLVTEGRAVDAAGRVFDAGVVRRMDVQIVEQVSAHHKADPLDAGSPRESVRERVAPSAAPGLFDAVIERLTRNGTLTGTDRLALSAHRQVKTSNEARAYEAVEQAFRAAGLVSPDVSAVKEAARLPAADIDRAVQLLLRERRLVRVGDLIFHADALTQFKAEVRKLSGGRAKTDPPVPLDVADVKQRYGLSRKYAIPLLEWLDRERVTRRVGATRIVL